VLFRSFSRGKDFERCIDLSKQLVTYYESQFDYAKLSQQLSRQAELFSRIISTERIFAEYFRVEFVGDVFGPENNNKAFIYRGGVSEDLRSFMDRIHTRFPDGQIRLDDKRGAMDSNLIFITTVRPASDPDKKEAPVDPKIPEKVLRYQRSNNVSIFSYSSLKRIEDEKAGPPPNEIRDLWCYKYYYVTQDTFPNQIRRSAVVRTAIVQQQPIDYAVFQLQESYDKLRRAIAENEPKPDRCGDTADISRLLGGMIDAAVNGGPRKYVDAFLSAEFAAQYSNKAVSIGALKGMLIQVAEIIPVGLKVHGRICSEQMMMLQNHLETKFQEDWMEGLIKPIQKTM